ncbi:MAG: hypothetical protein D6B26_03805, partial [Spirochaetaceae bacterium]
SFNSVGYFSEIMVDSSDIPYIAYYNISETGTRDALRLAKYEGAAGTIAAGYGSDGFATGNWTVSTVPVISVPQGSQSSFLKVNLGFTSTGVPTIGYAGNELEYTQPLPEI